jgi:glycosyltransferase involved in cell wall biosynthesis
MKILNISMYYLPILGGQCTYIENLIKVFEEKGIASTVLQPYSKFVASNVITLKHIPLAWKYIDSWFIFNFQILLKRLLIHKFDIVISHYSFHYPSLRQHKKVIILSHGLDWHQPPVSRVDRYRESTARLVNKEHCFVVANDSHFLRYLGFDIPAGENFFREVAPGKWFIPNCIDNNIFFDFKKPRQKRILVPRTVRPERGIHLAIEAFNFFRKKHPDFIMDIVGIYDPRWEYYQKCLKLVKDFGIMDKVNFLGGTEWNKLPAYYNQSMITLVPTIEMEGTSLSALESMACGTPVISTNAGGLCDLPTLKSTPDGNEIAEKMEEVLMQWDKYSASQMERTRSVFNLENWSQAWLRVVQKVYNS